MAAIISLPMPAPRSAADRTCRRARRWPRLGACAAAFVVLAAVVPGCGQPRLPRYALSGRVHYAGNSLPAGYIVFAPGPGSPTGGPASHADIHDGQYQVPAEAGVVGGPYVATIFGFDGERSEENGIVNALGKPLVAGFRLTIDLPAAASSLDLDIPAQSPVSQSNR